jgi:hypothetical protein
MRKQPTPKINKAFNKLLDFNIAAKKDWACCQSCGHAEMDEYLNTFNKNYRTGSLKLKNYIFFHDQDRDCLNSGGYTYLAYDLDEEAKKIVVKVFKDCGLNPEWDGNQNKRIKITERKTRNGEKKNNGGSNS